MPDNNNSVTPFSLKDAPALIEVLFPAQKLSAEVYKERMAGSGQTLTALGSYWKGRKPLILNKACVLGCLLPVTLNLKRDLEIFELLMGMDDRSFVARAKRRLTPKEILGQCSLARIADYFEVSPEGVLPTAGPVDWSKDPAYARVKVSWRADIPEASRRRLESELLPQKAYRERVATSYRPEEVAEVHEHIWNEVNAHLGTNALSVAELVKQLGVMRFGHRPRVADTFSGSGQIPFEAARLGCDVYASDLNPVACMLTWGAFHIIGGSKEQRADLARGQRALVEKTQAEIDRLGIETDGNGWRAKVFLYCAETRCPQSGWLVPILPTLVVSKGYRVIAELVPDPINRRYAIAITAGVSDAKLLAAAGSGTVRSGGRGQDPYLVHTVDGREYRTKISTLRGDYRKPDGTNANRLRQWEKHDFKPRSDDILQERLYCIQWMRLKPGGKTSDYEFRAVTEADLKRERAAEEYLAEHLAEWQEKGWIPDTQIEPGDKTDEPIRTRGWTYWHHLFNPRQLITFGIMYQSGKQSPGLATAITGALDRSSRLCAWGTSTGRDAPVNVFSNQALNTLWTYGAYSTPELLRLTEKATTREHSPVSGAVEVTCREAPLCSHSADIFITDPPYGDAVKYEEILEFFIAWMRKNPPKEFSKWVWDSRRALAVKGEDHDFKLGMVAAYKRMAEKMPDNGIQILMFTHQSGSIWADMANIVWASGLQVSAAWYVVTETDSALREGSYVKGTVLLVLRKRKGRLSTFRDDLAIELRDEVEAQVETLTGLNQDTKDLYRDENLFTDSDLQMAGYAAALRVLTRYAEIDGVDMTVEALRPRGRGEQTRVDRLIEYAVEIANQCLIPSGISADHWNKLQPAERFYLKMLDLESHKNHTLDNYQNFAKAFKVRDFHALMASERANSARLKSGAEFGRAEMSGESEIADTPLRGILYALMEFGKGADSDDVLAHLGDNVANYFQKRDTVVAVADFMASRLAAIREDEASHTRVLRDLVRNERLA